MSVPVTGGVVTAVMLKALLSTPVAPVLVISSVHPTHTVSTLRLLNVTQPPDGARVVVPVNAPPVG